MAIVILTLMPLQLENTLTNLVLVAGLNRLDWEFLLVLNNFSTIKLLLIILKFLLDFKERLLLSKAMEMLDIGQANILLKKDQN